MAARFAAHDQSDSCPANQKNRTPIQASVDLMTENPAGSNHGLGRGKCAIVELKAVDGCEERRRLRNVDGERRTSEEPCLAHPHRL